MNSDVEFHYILVSVFIIISKSDWLLLLLQLTMNLTMFTNPD